MGLFQKIKDGLFATKCIEQFKHVLPNAGKEAEQFCTQNLIYLTTLRDKGMNHEQAVNSLCTVMLNSPEKMLASDKTYGLESLLLASKYAASFVDRWQNSEYSPVFKQAIQKYITHLENDPIVKDLEMMSDRKPTNSLP